MSKATRSRSKGSPAGLHQVGLRARPGSRVTEEQVRDVGGEIVNLLSKKRLTVANLLKRASDPDSSANRHFEWDNDVAGPKWREEQARRFIRAIEIVVNDVPGASTVRLCWPAGQGRFVSFREMTKDIDLLAATMEQCRRDLAAFERKYDLLRGLPQAAELFEAFHKTMTG